MIEMLVLFGVPSAITGLFVWWIKKKIEANEKRALEREQHLEELVLLMLQCTRANTILSVATAEAVRDGHCNGNMSHALEVVEKAAAAEKEFLLDKSIKYVFE
jgi:hypothetical protein